MNKVRKTAMLALLVVAVSLNGGCVNAPVQGLADGVSRGVRSVVEDVVANTLLDFLNQP